MVSDYFHKVTQWQREWQSAFLGAKTIARNPGSNLVEVRLKPGAAEPPENVIVSFADGWSGLCGGYIYARDPSNHTVRVKVYID